MRTVMGIGMAADLAVLAPTAALATPPDTFRIPHRVNYGTERTTTVNFMTLMSWPPPAPAA